MNPVGLRALCVALRGLAVLVPSRSRPTATAAPAPTPPRDGQRRQHDGARRHDRLAGLGGNDRLNGGLGNDRVSGGAGADTIHAEFNGIDTVNCGPGRDTATVASGDRVSNCEQLRRLQL